MSFHTQTFSKRFQTMGDPAEAAFDRVHPKSHKLGLNRPPFYMGGMALCHRYTPDRLIREGEFECMGIGRDHTLKIKDEKIEALVRRHDALGPVWLFVYDQKDDTYYEAPIDQWVRQIDAHAESGTFSEGKTYKALKSEQFPVPPTPLPPD